MSNKDMQGRDVREMTAKEESWLYHDLWMKRKQHMEQVLKEQKKTAPKPYPFARNLQTSHG